MVDLEAREIAYCIRKPITSKTRPKRQQDFIQQFALASPGMTYFGARDPSQYDEPFALLHRGRF